MKTTTIKTTSLRIFGTLLVLGALLVIAPGVRADEATDRVNEMTRYQLQLFQQTVKAQDELRKFADEMNSQVRYTPAAVPQVRYPAQVVPQQRPMPLDPVAFQQMVRQNQEMARQQILQTQQQMMQRQQQIVQRHGPVYARPCVALAPPCNAAIEPNGFRGTIQVRLPDPQAAVWLDGKQVMSSGMVRILSTTPLQPGRDYSFEVSAAWHQDGRLFTVQHTVIVSAGGTAIVYFDLPAARDQLPRPLPAPASSK